MGQEKENQNEQDQKDRKNALEWTVFGISVLLVTAILIYLVYNTVTHNTSPADIQVEYNKSPTKTAPYRYHLVINNKGGETAEEVLVELVLQDDTVTIEKAELQLSFVPTSSKREGWVNFSKDPAKADTVIGRVVSFKKP